MTSLIIVESPAKCKKIEQYLGLTFKCVATYGHLTSLPDLKSIDIDNDFEPTYTIMKDKSKIISHLREAISNSKEVILGTDDDREGEAIAWHCCQLFNLSPSNTKRIIFHEITKPALIKAVSSPTKINIDLVHSQQCRQILDILVGFMFTPLLWKHISPTYKEGLSAGRCQTPTLRLIYENSKECANNVTNNTNAISGYFTKYNIKFSLSKHIDSIEDVKSFLHKSKTFQHNLTIDQEVELKTGPPTPFTTLKFQQKANQTYNMSPKESMNIAQKLYESGLITYMRTESNKFSKEFCVNLKKLIETRFGDKYVGNMEKISDEGKTPHEGIRVTDLYYDIKNENFTSKEKNIYEMIKKQTIQSGMSESKYLSMNVFVSAPEEKKYMYNSKKIIFDGWKILEKTSDKESFNDFFRLIKKNTEIKYNKIISEEIETNAKKHFTYSSVLKCLQEKGIGRPSTYASIIEKNISRGYVAIKNIPGKTVQTATLCLENDEIIMNNC